MASIVVELDDKPLERVPADLVVVGFSPDDRPLRGSAGRADWRLCGDLWGLVTSRKFNGTLGQAALLSAAGSLRSPLLLVLGLGHRAELVVDTWRELGRDVVRRALDLRVNRAVLGLVSDAANLGPEGTRALFGGAAVAAAERRAELRVAIVGEGALARVSELRSLAKAGLPAGASLRLPEAPEKPTKFPPIKAGDFTYNQGLRFK
ncbi:MAG: hypothetical protein IH974_01540 [Myxococcales bacterium]|jgi:hypothetical protein|nr:hypothetical protein [Myxococcales bacterium]